MTANGGLTRNQKRLIPHLLACRNIAEAAAKVGLGERTVSRWLAEDEAFQRALAKAEGEAIDAATRELVNLAGDAIRTLREVLGDKGAAPTARVRAADMVLSHLLRLRELRNIERRLVKLELEVYHNGQD
jgi:hypothetical protein